MKSVMASLALFLVVLCHCGLSPAGAAEPPIEEDDIALLSCVVAANGYITLMIADQQLPSTSLLDSVLNDVIYIYGSRQNITMQDQYEPALEMLADYIAKNDKSTVRRLPIDIGLIALRELLPEDKKHIISLEEAGTDLIKASLTMNGLQDDAHAAVFDRYYSYVYPQIFNKKVLLLVNTDQISLDEWKGMGVEIAIDELTFAAEYQLLRDPTLDLFANFGDEPCLDGIMKRLPNVSADSKEKLFQVAILKTWLTEWEKKMKAEAR